MIPRNANLLYLSAIMLGDHAAPVAAGIYAVRAALNGGVLGGGSGGGSEDGGSASKASKNGKSSADDSSSINIQPFTCPGKCVNANGVNGTTNLLEDAIVDCNEQDKGQEWIEHKEGGNVVSYESVAFPGWCLAVEHEHNLAQEGTVGWIQVPFSSDAVALFKLIPLESVTQFPDVYPGDLGWSYISVALNTNTTVDACTDGVVGLIPCGCPSTKWYNTGSQLLSLSCWEAGFSTSMSVDYDDESGECLSGLKSVQDDSGDVTWASTFMLKETGNSAGGLGFYDPLG